jgi:hypothetical protein
VRVSPWVTVSFMSCPPTAIPLSASASFSAAAYDALGTLNATSSLVLSPTAIVPSTSAPPPMLSQRKMGVVALGAPAADGSTVVAVTRTAGLFRAGRVSTVIGAPTRFPPRAMIVANPSLNSSSSTPAPYA